MSKIQTTPRPQNMHRVSQGQIGLFQAKYLPSVSSMKTGLSPPKIYELLVGKRTPGMDLGRFTHMPVMFKGQAWGLLNSDFIYTLKASYRQI